MCPRTGPGRARQRQRQRGPEPSGSCETAGGQGAAGRPGAAGAASRWPRIAWGRSSPPRGRRAGNTLGFFLRFVLAISMPSIPPFFLSPSCPCACGGPADAPTAEFPGPAPAGSGFFDDFRAAATAVCFALRSANPRAPWQAAALAALYVPASRWRFKHVNKARVSGEASVFSSLPLLE